MRTYITDTRPEPASVKGGHIKLLLREFENLLLSGSDYTVFLMVPVSDKAFKMSCCDLVEKHDRPHVGP